MDLGETRRQVLGLGAFRELPGAMRGQVADILVEISENVNLPKGAIIFTQGETGTDEGYVLLRGELEIRKTTAPDTTCQAPELIGEMKQFNPVHQRTATVETAGDVELLKFAWSNFEEAVRKRFDDDQAETVKNALMNYAWQHFTT